MSTSETRKQAHELVSQMTLEEKASLCSGLNFWYLKGIERLNLPSIMVTDGPHGLRKQEASADHLGINKSVSSTCFPPACATACSFDPELLTEIGKAMGDECLQEDVAVILGPGANIKRSPLCGRNFEYFSEDPLLSGELSAAMINGIQSKGIGTSLKHYAVNNQESRRMTIDAITDERALHEIYLKTFEIAVKKSQPWTMMCSYNRINGTYASDNHWLLTEVLRDSWGFEGLVITDWGAMNNRVEAVKAGCDLEMPHSNDANDKRIVAAVREGKLKEEAVDKLAIRVTEMILKYQAARKPDYTYDIGKHHALARKAAAESCVLLKNKNSILPLKPGEKVAVIGSFAKTPRYQGAGSSKINPHKIDNALEELTALGISAVYAEGYNGLTADDDLISKAVQIAKESEIAIIFAGLPDEIESEGFDRNTMDMPESHIKLIKEVAKANPNTVVVLQLGSPVVTDWAKDVKGLLVSYLGGQAGGGGIADVLTGTVNPSGKLAESWPVKLSDNPSYLQFPGGEKTVEYRESIFVGYRYYETVAKEVAWPFGFGLSYTTYAYSNLQIDGDEVIFTLENTGETAGAEAAQVYMSLPGSRIYRPAKWLVAFEKVFLQPGEKKTIHIKLTKEAYQYYNTRVKGWRVEGGNYTVMVGSFVNADMLSASMNITGDGDEDTFPVGYGQGYMKITGNDFNKSDFINIYGKALPPADRLQGSPFTTNDTLRDIQHTKLGARVLAETRKNAAAAMSDMSEDIKVMMDAMLIDMPLRALGMMGGDKIPPDFADSLVAALNGNFINRTINTIKLGLKMSRAGK